MKTIKFEHIPRIRRKNGHARACRLHCEGFGRGDNSISILYVADRRMLRLIHYNNISIQQIILIRKFYSFLCFLLELFFMGFFVTCCWDMLHNFSYYCQLDISFDFLDNSKTKCFFPHIIANLLLRTANLVFWISYSS